MVWKKLLGLFEKDSLCEEAYRECLVMLRDSKSMFDDAVASLWTHGTPEVDIYKRDRRINRFERKVRRDIVTHLAVNSNPDITGALVLTAIVIDIERLGDYAKNIVELASAHPKVFHGGELEGEIKEIEATVTRLFENIPGALASSDADKARQIIGDHQMVADRIEDLVQDLIAGKVMARDSGEAVTAALYLRYLKRISAHLKNVATSVVNPYYRIGFREKTNPDDEPEKIENDGDE
ncbi:MAG: phosphate uptake regulator PhoU [Candidatus Eisenbacteria bacterium]|nr:phosphate uptake regulator PhoU [Candidatus Eisenbacteria bacterium]